MRLVLAGLFLAAPCIALACSSFTAATGPETADAAGVDAATGTSLDSGSPDPVGTIALAHENLRTTGISASGGYVFWIVDGAKIHGRDTTASADLSVALPSGVAVSGIGTDGANVYWLERGFSSSAVAYGNVRTEPIDVLSMNDATKARNFIPPTTPPFSLFAFSPTEIVAGPNAEDLAHAFGKNGTPNGGNVYHSLDHVIVDDLAVMYTYEDNVLYRTLIPSGAEKKMASRLSSPTSLVSDSGNVYAIVGGNAIVQAPIDEPEVDDTVDGGLRRVVTFDSTGGLLASDHRGGLVLWTKDGTISHVDVAQGTMTPLTTNAGQATSLAAIGNLVYWTTESGDVMQLRY